MNRMSMKKYLNPVYAGAIVAALAFTPIVHAQEASAAAPAAGSQGDLVVNKAGSLDEL